VRISSLFFDVAGFHQPVAHYGEELYKQKSQTLVCD